MLTATENGYGKRTPIVEYTRHGRGTKGMIAIQQSERNGKVVAAALVHPDDEVMLISTGGVLIRTSVKSIREMSRSHAGRHADQPRPTARSSPASSGWSRPTTTSERRRRTRMSASPRRTADARDRAGTAQAIDALDRELLARLNERARHAQAIGDAEGRGVGAYRPEREAQVLARLHGAERRAAAQRRRSPACSAQVMSACLRARAAAAHRLSRARGHLQPRRGHQALRRLVEAVPLPTIDEVFRAVESGQADYAVVPVENSTEGAVGRTLDLMCTTDALGVRRGASCASTRTCCRNARDRSAAITRVYSHAQSLAQCVQWLAQHLPARPAHRGGEQRRGRAPRRGGARRRGHRRRERRARSTACRRSRRTSRTSPTTRTRFWVLGHASRSRRPGRDETSLVMSAPNRPGRRPRAARAVRAARRVDDALRVAPRAHRAAGSTSSSSTSSGHRDDAAVAAALAELADVARRSSSCSARIPAALD